MALTPEARQTFTRLFGTEPTPHPSPNCGHVSLRAR